MKGERPPTSGRLLIVVFSVGVSTLACAHASKLVPDQSTQSPGTGAAALEVVGGVRFSADGNAWRGFPVNLGSDVTPIEVRIHNHSGKPIRLVYERFALVAENGREFYALPLFPLSGESDKTKVLSPIYPSEKFFVAQRLRGVYQTLTPWPNPLPRDESLYRQDLKKWDEDLPTLDMLEKGMPEGVLADGGTIRGFLYFDGDARHEHKLVLTADVSESDRERRVALIKIPFRIE